MVRDWLLPILSIIKTSWHGNHFHITGPLWGELLVTSGFVPFTVGQWYWALRFPLVSAWTNLNKQARCRWIVDVSVLIGGHCNDEIRTSQWTPLISDSTYTQYISYNMHRYWSDLILPNSFAPGKFEWNFRHVILKQIFMIDGWGIFCEITLIWLSLDFTNDQVNIGSSNGMASIMIFFFIFSHFLGQKLFYFEL